MTVPAEAGVSAPLSGGWWPAGKLRADGCGGWKLLEAGTAPTLIKVSYSKVGVAAKVAESPRDTSGRPTAPRFAPHLGRPPSPQPRGNSRTHRNTTPPTPLPPNPPRESQSETHLGVLTMPGHLDRPAHDAHPGIRIPERQRRLRAGVSQTCFHLELASSDSLSELRHGHMCNGERTPGGESPKLFCSTCFAWTQTPSTLAGLL